jgi:chitinase
MIIDSLFLLLLLLSHATLTTSNNILSHSVVAYLPEWRYEGAHWNAITQHTTHLILFSLEIESKTGALTSLDRFPRPALYKEARTAATKQNCKLLICIGGNGRSSGFSPVSRSKKLRSNFLKSLKIFIDKHQLDGVDYNWEYPGYQFGRGYLSEDEVKKDYAGLLNLLRETRELLGPDSTITMSYYPDKRQESLLVEMEATKYVDLFHAMAYDNRGEHSTMKHFESATKQAIEIFGHKFSDKVTIGLPFYGRNVRTGDWKSYESIVQGHQLTSNMNKAGDQYFNGVDMIRKKVRHSMEHGMGGVMIWEVGQDCRIQGKKTGDYLHVKTCQDEQSKDSLLLAITDELNIGLGSSLGDEM